jgi:hypothetical protein
MLIYVLTVPVCMLIDYYLTLLGESLSKEYREHYVLKEYELNPMWQNDVRKKKWFNPKQLVLVVVFTAVFYFFISYLYEDDYNLLQFMMGMFIAPYITVIARHLTNLMLFIYVRKNPTLLEGKVIIPYQYMLVTSRIMAVPGIFTFVVIYAFTQSIFVLGGVVGSGLFFLVHYIWALKARKKASNNFTKPS